MRPKPALALLACAAVTSGCAFARKPEKTGRFIEQAKKEIRERDYLQGSKDLDAALVNDFQPGDEPWRPRADRLHRLVQEMGLENHVEDQKSLREQNPAARVAYEAVTAFIGDETDRAMLLAHAALGTDPHNGSLERFLDAMGRATGKKVERDLIAPPQCIAEKMMDRALRAVYIKQYKAALGLMRDALWLDPGNSLAWTRLGSSYFAMGDRVHAKAAYDKALQLEPGDQKLRAFMKRQNLE